MQYGVIISNQDGPSTRKFSFVIDKGVIVRRGQFVQADVEDGKLIGRVIDVRKTNRYFINPESVKNIQDSGKSMSDSYPVWEWEYLIADVNALGVFVDSDELTGFHDSAFPPSPGTTVMEPELDILERFFGLDKNGLYIGNIPYHKLDVKLSMTKLLQKHLAILAISGAGKSFLASAIIEELLDRPEKLGKMSVIVIDSHGEYTSFADDPNYVNKTKIFSDTEMKISFSSLSPPQIEEYTQLTSAQTREFMKITSKLKGRKYDIKDVIKSIEEKDDLNIRTQDILLSMCYELKRIGLFGIDDYPKLDHIAVQGNLSVIDLSGTTNPKKRQILVSYIARKLFNARKNGWIAPFLLIIEEAHQYIPEKVKKEHAISMSILQTIAREGRKFNASLCLISQRPVQLSTTVLSQCNTQIVLRITNPYDLKHIGESSEGITKDVLDQITSLHVGTGLVIGEAVNFPLFIKIRKRKSKKPTKSLSLEEAAVEYDKKIKQKLKDAESFM